jgi:hypothetical protein
MLARVRVGHGKDGFDPNGQCRQGVAQQNVTGSATFVVPTESALPGVHVPFSTMTGFV